MEESGKHSEQELEILWEKFCVKETDIGAKYLWLQYTLSKLDVPKNVLDKMIEIIEYDIQSYEDKHTSYGALSKKEKEKLIFMLLEFAKEKPDDFWKILQTPDNNILVCQFDEDLLEKTRIAFPHKRKLKPGELYVFFGKQLGMKEEEEGLDIEERVGLDIGERVELDIGERMRYRYRTYIKNKKAEELLFE
jgi:hypothetical protein